MCDYSQESLRSRQAEAGDRLVFSDHSHGLARPEENVPGAGHCLTCVEEGTVLKMTFPQRTSIQSVNEAGSYQEVVVRHGTYAVTVKLLRDVIKGSNYRDAVLFEDGNTVRIVDLWQQRQWVTDIEVAKPVVMPEAPVVAEEAPVAEMAHV